MENKSAVARVFIGSVLIIIGILYFLSNTELIDFSVTGFIFSWKTILMVIGAAIIVNSQRKTLGFIFLLTGAAAWIASGFGLNFWEFVFPIVLLALGAYIIFKQKNTDGKTAYGQHGKGPEIQRDRIDDVAIFGGGKKFIVSDNFKGGDITAIFGGSEIDLRQCVLADGDNLLDVFMVFGGSDIIVPKDWNVNVDVISIFGGFSNKLVFQVNSDGIDKSKTLIIKGLVIFGGGEVKVF